jgi:hypothetical protein
MAGVAVLDDTESVVLLPLQILAGLADAVSVATGIAVIVTESGYLQPLASVTVQIYLPGARLEITAVV